jgi:2-oxoglutarate ferredoxin oxidoreductase subunit alpha
MGAAIGAAYGGLLGMTGTSGPGLALKSEAINLAVMTELPVVIVDVQRAGPSTGMPTKTEQGDLLQALYGRNGESPMPVLAPATPAECFDLAFEAARIALKYMTPVTYLSDAFLATGAEPWRVPEVDSSLDRGPERDRPHVPPTPAIPRRSPGCGRSLARRASSTGSAASRRRTSSAA